MSVTVKGRLGDRLLAKGLVSREQLDVALKEQQAVLKSEIDFSRLPAETPAAIRRLLRRCLERNPKNRLHDIADARIVIDEAMAGGEEPREAAPVTIATLPASRPMAVPPVWPIMARQVAPAPAGPP
mgnify:CR=1 FL=1